MPSHEEDGPRSWSEANAQQNEVGGLPYPAGKLIEKAEDTYAMLREAEKGLQAGEPIPVEVDPAGQALVWGLTASQHATEYLEMMHRRQELDNTLSREEGMRLIYLEKASKMTMDLATMWTMIATVQPGIEPDETGQGRTD